MKIERLVAHIPARAGSKRVRSKNLRLMNGKPMIAYAIECAKACPEIETVYVNTDSPELMELARELGVEVYERDPSLASDTASGDDFTQDIMTKLNLDTLLMISPVCPLVTPEDVSKAIAAYTTNPEADTLITCTETSMQTAKEGSFVNIVPDGPLAPSQDNPKIQICNWAVTIWNANVFLQNYARTRGGYCGSNRILFPIDPLHAVKVSYEEDFRMAEALLAHRAASKVSLSEPKYWDAAGGQTGKVLK
jgi:CMP-N-acetylneuraminic acid synthetase